MHGAGHLLSGLLPIFANYTHPSCASNGAQSNHPPCFNTPSVLLVGNELFLSSDGSPSVIDTYISRYGSTNVENHADLEDGIGTEFSGQYSHGSSWVVMSGGKLEIQLGMPVDELVSETHDSGRVCAFVQRVLNQGCRVLLVGYPVGEHMSSNELQELNARLEGYADKMGNEVLYLETGSLFTSSKYQKDFEDFTAAPEAVSGSERIWTPSERVTKKIGEEIGKAIKGAPPLTPTCHDIVWRGALGTETDAVPEPGAEGEVALADEGESSSSKGSGGKEDGKSRKEKKYGWGWWKKHGVWDYSEDGGEYNEPTSCSQLSEEACSKWYDVADAAQGLFSLCYVDEKGDCVDSVLGTCELIAHPPEETTPEAEPEGSNQLAGTSNSFDAEVAGVPVHAQDTADTLGDTPAESDDGGLPMLPLAASFAVGLGLGLLVVAVACYAARGKCKKATRVKVEHSGTSPLHNRWDRGPLRRVRTESRSSTSDVDSPPASPEKNPAGSDRSSPPLGRASPPLGRFPPPSPQAGKFSMPPERIGSTPSSRNTSPQPGRPSPPPPSKMHRVFSDVL